MDQKFYALIAISQPATQPHHYDVFSQCQVVDAVQDDDNVRVVFPRQIRLDSKMKKTAHHSQLLQLYTTSPIRLESSRIHEH